MTVYALWYGGDFSYATADPERDLEAFPSIQAAGDALRSRHSNGDWSMQAFNFVNREPESGYTPCVSDNCSMHVYVELTTDDDTVLVHDNGPDRVITIGPRGGIRTERA